MRQNTSKLFSGVDTTFVMDNNLEELVAGVTFMAAANFKPTVDHPMACDPIINTQRPARARNNYGLVQHQFSHGDKLYYKMSSYGSGCGAASVGTTYK